MKVLVTGCAGFIGANLAARFADENIKFIGIDNLEAPYYSSQKRRNVSEILSAGVGEFIEGDLNDKALYRRLRGRGITHIVHLAARASVKNSNEDPKGCFSANVFGSQNVLSFAAKNNIKRLIPASTCSVYGKNPLPSTEAQGVSSPVSFYGASKIAMEGLAHAYWHSHKLPITILRLFTSYGRGGRPDMAVHSFAQAILSGKPISIWGDAGIERDFVHVSDTVESIMLSLGLDCGYEIFNIGTGRASSLEELISILEKNLGHKAGRKYVPVLSGDVHGTLADISKAKEQLGYRPKTGLEQGVSDFVKWFRSSENY